MKLSMPTISPALRISFGLAMFTVSVLLIADLIGVIPDKDKLLFQSRQKISESLAVQLSVAATTKNHYIIDAVLQSLVKRNDDIAAISMTKQSGEVISEFGEFSEAYYQNIDSKRSFLDRVIVPIFNGSEQWGSVNIEFVNESDTGIFGGLSDSIIGMLLFIFFSCLIGYMHILKKALHVLDPKAVVPDRVRAAFNTLSEGVLILDKKEQIMMANDAFSRQIDETAEKLIGTKASSLKLKLKKTSEDEKLPWFNAIENGSNQIGVAIDMSTPSKGVRAMSTNSAPIRDDNGNTRGALVTFDDVTEVEETNTKLKDAVDMLQQSDARIRRKNRELKVLASRDPLTGCYNRRSFFELFEDMFQRAISENTKLCCIMLDIDHFKTINDRFGHSIGDEMLRMVSEIINLCNYDGAVIGRYGGEEFCIALPDAELEVASQVAEDLRVQIKEASEKFSANDTTISASFGVASIESAMETHSQLLEQADTALYTAKNSGRDRVVTWVDHAHLNNEIFDNLSGGVQSLTESPNRSEMRLKLLYDKIIDLKNELEQKEKESGRDKLNDAVTGLPTRLIYEDRIRQSIALSERTNGILAVVILNIDMFSRINNTLGQVVGDKFLMAIGQRIKSVMRSSDTIATFASEHKPEPSLSRLRDDEFSLLLTGFDSVDSLTYVVQRIQKEMAGKIRVDDNEIYITATIGIAVYPEDGDTPESLIEKAQAAQKQAKHISGRNNYMFYSQEIHHRISSVMKREMDIHKALENNEFYMMYQPKLDLKKGVIDSMEALIRWEHPEQGLISPVEFIPQAEEAGLIVEIGEWCLRTVCTQIRKWKDMGAENLRVSVNISAGEFSSDDFVEKIDRVIKEADINASNLELEITETTVMADTNQSKNIINDLRFRNVTVTLDDFGTGYSSLNYLGNLNFDWIKIDRYFMLEAMKHPRSKTLYTGIVRIAQEIGLKVVSEGIETEDEYNYVKSLGVDELQGYILHKPLHTDAVTNLLFAEKSGVQIAV